MRLVELDVALDALREVIVPAEDIGFGDELADGYNDGINMAITVMNGMPTVDAEPVRHGRWIRENYWSQGVGMGESYGYYYNCFKCGNLVRGGYNECGKKYCDECGAKMDGKDGDHETD